MIKRLALLIVILFFSINTCLGQRRAGAGLILFRGVIMDASSQDRLGSSQILINRTRPIISAEDGTFSFYAHKKDTILFSMLGYKSAALIVNDTLSGKEFLTGVYLETDTMVIGEVIIVPKLTNLKAEMKNPKIRTDTELENARSNITTASYLGKTSQPKLGDPANNYDLIRQQQRVAANEKGGIPSDKIVGINPLILFSAAYHLLRRPPEIPLPPKPQISTKEIEELHALYLESLKKRK
jgi:hypothetical protein